MPDPATRFLQASSSGEVMMSDQIILPGDKLHIITRRLFADDLRRHFAGEVARVAGALCEVHGFVFVFHSGSNEYQKRPRPRSRIYSLADGMHIVNKLPADVKIETLEYRVAEGRLVVSGNAGFELDINEFGPNA